MSRQTTEPCDTCGAKRPHGGGEAYTDVRGRERYGCKDQHACCNELAARLRADRRWKAPTHPDNRVAVS